MARIPRDDSETASLRGDDTRAGRGRGRRRLQAVLVLAATLAFVASPYLTQGFSGFDPALFPIPQDEPPVQPAGYAFGIWGVIYLGLAASALFGLLARAEAPGWDAVRLPLILSLVIGSGWIAAANMDPIIATIMIWAMLLTALVALRRAPAQDRWWLTTPLALYAGWLSAASWVSVGLLLGGSGLLSPVAAALVALGLGAIFAGVVQIWVGRAPEYGLAVIWALIAVVVANMPANLFPALVAAAGVGVMIAAARQAYLAESRTART